MKSKTVVPAVGFAIFGFVSYVEKVFQDEILSSISSVILLYILKIISFVMISFLVYDHPDEIKETPERYPLFLSLVFLLWLTNKFYTGQNITKDALRLLVLNLAVFLWTAFSRRINKRITFF